MRILVAGASGFIGRALAPALVAAGHDVRAGLRRPASRAPHEGVAVRFDLDDPASLAPALAGVDAVVWLVHGLQREGFADWEAAVAARFAEVAREAGLQRLVYVGGVAPTRLTLAGRAPAPPSEHLAARQRTGALLQHAARHALELRAGVVVGAGGASFRLLRDVAARAPVLVRMPWLASEQQPVALADVVAAITAVVDERIDGVLDVPGPQVVTTEAFVRMTAAMLGRRVRFVDAHVPVSWVIEGACRLSRADAAVVRGLLGGVEAVDYVAADDGVFRALPGLSRTPLDVAVRRALIDEEATLGPLEQRVEEVLAQVWR